MTNNEITEYLNEEANKLLPGIKVTAIFPDEYRFDYNDTVTVIRPNAIERLSKKDMKIEIVIPTVAKIKAYDKSRGSVGIGIYSGYGRKEAEAMVKVILGDAYEEGNK